jgi:hypothetical protein
MQDEGAYVAAEGASEASSSAAAAAAAAAGAPPPQFEGAAGGGAAGGAAAPAPLVALPFLRGRITAGDADVKQQRMIWSGEWSMSEADKVSVCAGLGGA